MTPRLLFIGGGSNAAPGEVEPPGSNERMMQIAAATGTVAAELRTVPNQPLTFHGDGQPRWEDDLIGYAWAHFLETGDEAWLPRGPMVKSAVRAMDALEEFSAGREDIANVSRFVVAGGSKRGWTTWLTGAMDSRVIAIAPIVIDVLSVDASMRHHFAAYGFWAPAIGNYVAHGIMQRLDHPRLAEIYRLVDPYAYLRRLTLPKLVLNAAGDQFFLPDSSRFYWNDLRGESYLRYVANADHGMDGSDALATLTAFHSLMVRGEKPPQLAWSRSEHGTLTALATPKPHAARLWQATNPRARGLPRRDSWPQVRLHATRTKPKRHIHRAGAPTRTRLVRLLHGVRLGRRRCHALQTHDGGCGSPQRTTLRQQAPRPAPVRHRNLLRRQPSDRRTASQGTAGRPRRGRLRSTPPRH